MLTIRREQMAIFETSARKRFEDYLFEELHRFAPSHCRSLGPEDVHGVIRLGVSRAETHMFTRQGPVRFYVQLMFMFGSWFDTDVQYPWAAEALWDDSLPDEMARAEALHMGMLAYLGSVFGPGRMFARKALRPLRAALLEPAPEDRDALRRQLPQVLERVYPGKCRWLGEARLNAVIDGAWKVAAVYSIDSPRALRLLTMFAFMLGHRFHEDPLYPWIAGPLEAGRADRLETSAILYLDGVLKEVEG